MPYFRHRAAGYSVIPRAAAVVSVEYKSVSSVPPTITSQNNITYVMPSTSERSLMEESLTTTMSASLQPYRAITNTQKRHVPLDADHYNNYNNNSNSNKLLVSQARYFHRKKNSTNVAEEVDVSNSTIKQQKAQKKIKDTKNNSAKTKSKHKHDSQSSSVHSNSEMVSQKSKGRGNNSRQGSNVVMEVDSSNNIVMNGKQKNKKDKRISVKLSSDNQRKSTKEVPPQHPCVLSLEQPCSLRKNNDINHVNTVMDTNTTNNNTDTTSHSSPSSPSLLEIHTVEGVVKEWMRMCEADDENALRALQREPLMARGKGDGDGPFASNSNSKNVIVDTNTSEYDGQNLTDSQIKLVTFFVSCIMKTLANSHFTVNEILLRYAKHQGIVISSRAQDTIHDKSNVNGISCNTMARSTLYLVNVIISFHTNVLSEIETGESWERGLPTLNTTSLGEETATVVKPRDIKYSDSATLPTRRLQQDEVTIKKHNVVPDSHSSVVKLSHEGILSSTDREDLRLALVRKRRKKFSKGNPAPPLSFMKAIIPSKAASEKRILDRAREGQSLHGLTDTSIEGRVKGTSTAVPYETVTAMGSRPPGVFGAAVMNSTEVASEQPLAIFLMHFEPVLSTIRVDSVATASSKSTPVSPESSVVTVATEAVVHLYCPMIGSLILSHRIPLTQLPSSSHTEMRRDMSVENIRELFLDGTNDFEEGGTISTPGTKGAQSHNHDGISGTRWGLIQKLNDHCRRHYGVSSGSAYNGYLTAESASEWCNLNSEGFHGSPYKMAFISLTAATPISTPSPTASSSSPRESSETARNIQNISEMKQYTLLDDQLCEVDKKKGSRGEASGSRAPENYDSSKNQLITAIKEANQRQKSNLRDIGKGTSKNILKRGMKGNDSPKGSPRGCDEEDIVCPDKPTGVTLETLITNTASGAWCKQAETTFMDLLHYGGISGITEVNIAGLVAALLRSVDMRRLTVNGDETPTATTSSNEDAASAIIENNNNPNRLENTEMAIKKEKVSEEQKKKIFISPLTMQSPRVKHCIINEAFTRFGTGAINSESKYIYTTSTKSQPNIATSSNNNNGQSLSSTPAFPSRPLLDGALLQKCLTRHPSRQSEYYTFTWQGAGLTPSVFASDTYSSLGAASEDVQPMNRAAKAVAHAAAEVANANSYDSESQSLSGRLRALQRWFLQYWRLLSVCSACSGLDGTPFSVIESLILPPAEVFCIHIVAHGSKGAVTMALYSVTKKQKRVSSGTLMNVVSDLLMCKTNHFVLIPTYRVDRSILFACRSALAAEGRMCTVINPQTLGYYLLNHPTRYKSILMKISAISHAESFTQQRDGTNKRHNSLSLTSKDSKELAGLMAELAGDSDSSQCAIRSMQRTNPMSTLSRFRSNFPDLFWEELKKKLCFNETPHGESELLWLIRETAGQQIRLFISQKDLVLARCMRKCGTKGGIEDEAVMRELELAYTLPLHESSALVGVGEEVFDVPYRRKVSNVDTATHDITSASREETKEVSLYVGLNRERERVPFAEYVNIIQNITNSPYSWLYSFMGHPDRHASEARHFELLSKKFILMTAITTDLNGYGRSNNPTLPESRLIAAAFMDYNGHLSLPTRTYLTRAAFRFPSLTNYDVLVAHNAKQLLLHVWEDEDFNAFLNRGGKVWCTMYGEYLLSGQQVRSGANSLVEVSSRYTSYDPNVIRLLSSSLIGFNRERLPLSLLSKILHSSVKLLGSTFLGQLQLGLKNLQLKSVAFRMDAMLAMGEMEHRGLAVDVDLVTEQARELYNRMLVVDKALSFVKPRKVPSELRRSFDWSNPSHLYSYYFGGRVLLGNRKNTNHPQRPPSSLHLHNQFEAEAAAGFTTIKDPNTGDYKRVMTTQPEDTHTPLLETTPSSPFPMFAPVSSAHQYPTSSTLPPCSPLDENLSHLLFRYGKGPWWICHHFKTFAREHGLSLGYPVASFHQYCKGLLKNINEEDHGKQGLGHWIPKGPTTDISMFPKAPSLASISTSHGDIKGDPNSSIIDHDNYVPIYQEGDPDTLLRVTNPSQYGANIKIAKVFKCFFFDLETTGLNSEIDTIVELSFYDPLIDEAFTTLVNPERDIPNRTTRIHHITQEMVKHAPTFRELLAPLIQFLGLRFEDTPAGVAACQRLGLPPNQYVGPKKDVYDSQRIPIENGKTEMGRVPCVGEVVMLASHGTFALDEPVLRKALLTHCPEIDLTNVIFVDTMPLFRMVKSDQGALKKIQSLKLGDIKSALELVDDGELHRAETDTRVLWQCLLKVFGFDRFVATEDGTYFTSKSRIDPDDQSPYVYSNVVTTTKGSNAGNCLASGTSNVPAAASFIRKCQVNSFLRIVGLCVTSLPLSHCCIRTIGSERDRVFLSIEGVAKDYVEDPLELEQMMNRKVVDGKILKRLAELGCLTATLNLESQLLERHSARFLQFSDSGTVVFVHPDNKVRQEIDCTSTLTSRTTSSNPSCHNIPKTDGDGPAGAIRRIFISRFGKNGRCVEIDYSQLEVAVLGILASDARLLTDLHNEVDFHCRRASFFKSHKKTNNNKQQLNIFQDVNIPPIMEDKEEINSYNYILKGYHEGDPECVSLRRKAKIVSFQRMYGGGINLMAKTTGLPRAVLQRCITAEENEYPGIRAFHKLVRTSCLRLGNPGLPTHYVFELPTGFRVTFNTRDVKYNMPPLKNYPIQGYGAELVQIIIGRLFRSFHAKNHYNHKAYIVNFIHDSVWIDCHKDVCEAVVQDATEMLASMSVFIPEEFPGAHVPVEMHTVAMAGVNLGELQPIMRTVRNSRDPSQTSDDRKESTQDIIIDGGTCNQNLVQTSIPFVSVLKERAMADVIQFGHYPACALTRDSIPRAADHNDGSTYSNIQEHSHQPDRILSKISSAGNIEGTGDEKSPKPTTDKHSENNSNNTSNNDSNNKMVSCTKKTKVRLTKEQRKLQALIRRDCHINVVNRASAEYVKSVEGLVAVGDDGVWEDEDPSI